jgi:hypothetical protein
MDVLIAAPRELCRRAPWRVEANPACPAQLHCPRADGELITSSGSAGSPFASRPRVRQPTSGGVGGATGRSGQDTLGHLVWEDTWAERRHRGCRTPDGR